MATPFLVNIPILPQKSSPTNSSVSTTYSSQTSINEEYFTPRSSVQSSNAASESDSTLTDHSLTEDTDNDEEKHVRFDIPPLKPEIQLKLENDEAEFFAYIPPEDSTENRNKSRRKRDRIRSVFYKKLHRSTSNSSDASSTEWNEVLAKTLVSMHADMENIINGFDQIDQLPTDESSSNTSETILTKPHLSFNERQRQKLEMMRIAQMLHPPNLLTYEMKESPYPYTDIIEPNHFHLLRVKKGIPDENLFIQCKPFHYKKFRHRTQRSLLRIKHDLKKIRHDIYGENLTKAHQEVSSLDGQNYQYRLEKTLLEFRKQIAEYDRVHSSITDSRPSIAQIIAKMSIIDPTTKMQIDDYRAKSRPMGYINTKAKTELISAPYIPRQIRNHQTNLKPKTNIDYSMDIRFDPTTFIDLNEEAEKFFGRNIPFWNKPLRKRLSIALPLERRERIPLILPSKLGIWNRFVISFKTKQKLLKKIELKQRQLSNDDLYNHSNENNEDFFDCTSVSFKRRKSRSLNSLNNLNTVEF